MLMWPVGNHTARTSILSCDFMCTQRLHYELLCLLVFAKRGLLSHQHYLIVSLPFVINNSENTMFC